MTLIVPEKISCAICHEVSEHLILQSSNSMGAPDLDTRPSEMLRSTMSQWTQRCPACGYAAEDISEATHGVDAIVRSDEYRHLLHDERLPDLARTFMCEAYIQRNLGNIKNAIWATIHSAWVCDDAEENDRAVEVRCEALALIEEAIASGVPFAVDPTSEFAIRVDLARRAGRFDDAIRFLGEKREVTTPHLRAVLLFEERLIADRDVKCFTVEDALFYEAAVKEVDRQRKNGGAS